MVNRIDGIIGALGKFRAEYLGKEKAGTKIPALSNGNPASPSGTSEVKHWQIFGTRKPAPLISPPTEEERKEAESTITNAAQIGEFNLSDKAGSIIQKGGMDWEVASELGFSPELFRIIDWVHDDFISIYELAGILNQIKRSAAAHYGADSQGNPSVQALKTTAAEYMKAKRINGQDFAALGIERASVEGKLSGAKTIDEILSAMELSGKVGPNGMCLDEMKAYKDSQQFQKDLAEYAINADKKVSQLTDEDKKTVFLQHYDGLIKASRFSPKDQKEIFHVVREGGITGIPWSGHVHDYAAWYAGEQKVEVNVLEGDPGADMDIQWIQQEMQFNGTWRIMQGFINDGNWESALPYVQGYVGQLREMLASNPNSIAILQEINTWLGYLVKSAINEYRQPGTESRLIDALAVTGKGGKTDSSKLQTLMGLIDDYESILMSSQALSAGKNLGEVGQWRGIVARGLAQKASEYKIVEVKSKKQKGKTAKTQEAKLTPETVEARNKAEEYHKLALAACDRLKQNIANTERISGGSANEAKRQLALIYVELTGTLPDDKDNKIKRDRLLEESLALADGLTPLKKASVYVRVFSYLVAHQRFDEAIALLNTQADFIFKPDGVIAKSHRIPPYNSDSTEQEAEELRRDLSMAESLVARNVEHEGGLFDNAKVRKAIEDYRKSGATTGGKKAHERPAGLPPITQ